MVKKVGIILSTLLILVGFTGFLGGLLISLGVVHYESELPLGDVNGIVVDDNENMYIGLGFYGKVQVYNSSGEFIKNWRVSSSGGTFNMRLTEDQEVLVTVARGDKQIFYDQNGKELKTKPLKSSYKSTERSWNTFKSTNGKRYQVKVGMFPKIVRTSPDSKELVKQGLILSLMRGPFPVWLFMALGVGLNILLRKDKVKERINRFSKGRE